MARYNVWLLSVLAGQLGLAAGVVALGRVELDFRWAYEAGPDWFTKDDKAYGLPTPWWRARHTMNRDPRIERRESKLTNPLVPVAAGLFVLAAPVVIGNVVIGPFGRRRGTDYRADRLLRAVIVAAVLGLFVAWLEALLAGHILCIHICSFLSDDLVESETVNDLYRNYLAPALKWRSRQDLPTTDRVYTQVTAAGLLFGAAVGCLIFRPWRRAGGPSASDGAAATTLPSA